MHISKSSYNTSTDSAYYKDIFSVNTIYDTIARGGYNGGNNTNIYFKDTAGQKYKTPTTAALTSISPLTGVAGTVITFTITGGYYPLSSVTINGVAATNITPIDSNSFTAKAPAGTGTGLTVAFTNCDGKTGQLAGAWGYTAAKSYREIIGKFGYSWMKFSRRHKNTK